MPGQTRRISVIDLFCGAGGLSLGLNQAGLDLATGIDLDPRCSYPFEKDLGAPFLCKDVRDVTGAELDRIWGKSTLKVLAGCAPCQPFSTHRRGADTSHEDEWPLLREFGRLVRATRPHVLTMENVLGLSRQTVFSEFLATLAACGYSVSHQSCYCPEYGLPQSRRRLVLIASRIGPIKIPPGTHSADSFVTVRHAIGDLPPLRAGQADAKDPLHKVRNLTPINLARIRASHPGGTWRDWPTELRAPCHQRSSGATFQSVYARMSWDMPSPTITAGSYNFGSGRFGHPEQDRALSLREAAILQGFPRDYKFVPAGVTPELAPIGRLIGNAVPAVLGRSIGSAILDRVKQRHP